MPNVKILHNPRCSKSRQTLQLLEQQGHSIEVVEYLKTPPTADELNKIREQLGLATFLDFMRIKEAEFKQAGLSKSSTEQEMLQAMLSFPKLIERPIVIYADKAKIGRPPEAVLELF